MQPAPTTVYPRGFAVILLPSDHHGTERGLATGQGESCERGKECCNSIGKILETVSAQILIFNNVNQFSPSFINLISV